MHQVISNPFHVESVDIYIVVYQEGQHWNPINQYNSAPFLCLSQVKNWISISML